MQCLVLQARGLQQRREVYTKQLDLRRREQVVGVEPVHAGPKKGAPGVVADKGGPAAQSGVSSVQEWFSRKCAYLGVSQNRVLIPFACAACTIP